LRSARPACSCGLLTIESRIPCGLPEVRVSGPNAAAAGHADQHLDVPRSPCAHSSARYYRADCRDCSSEMAGVRRNRTRRRVLKHSSNPTVGRPKAAAIHAATAAPTHSLRKTLMTRLITSLAAAIAFAGFGLSNASAGHDTNGPCPCPCPCGPSVQSAPEAAPPSAPAVGETQQSQSVQPQTAPPAAPSTGTTYRSYSYQPAPAYRTVPRASRRAPLDPVQRRQHPSNRFLW
jgi:hypothetical protein